MRYQAALRPEYFIYYALFGKNTLSIQQFYGYTLSQDRFFDVFCKKKGVLIRVHSIESLEC